MKKIKIREIAELLGRSPQSVRIGLQRGELKWGEAVKTSSRYTYFIYPAKFTELTGIRLKEGK